MIFIHGQDLKMEPYFRLSIGYKRIKSYRFVFVVLNMNHSLI